MKDPMDISHEAAERELCDEAERLSNMALRTLAVAEGFTDLYGDDGMGIGLRGTINGRVEWVRDYFRKKETTKRDSEINRAMAEVAGWGVLEHDLFPDASPHKWIVLGPSRNPSRAFVFPDESVNRYLPNFLTDLNAVHEVEKLLPPGIIKGGAYERALCRVTNNPYCATARQRTTAILKIFNKWKPEWDQT